MYTVEPSATLAFSSKSPRVVCKKGRIMASDRVKQLNHRPEFARTETAGVATCPVCDGNMEVLQQGNGHSLSVCANCHADVTAFGAWTIARRDLRPGL